MSNVTSENNKVRNVVARINRRLRSHDQRLRKTRSARMRWQVGDFYVHDCRHNLVLETWVDPESFWHQLEADDAR